MSGRSGRGPRGQGPMAGRRLGLCGGAETRENETPAEPGSGPGWGGGWRHRHRFHATGLTGWQRARLDEPGPDSTVAPMDSRAQKLLALKREIEILEQAVCELKSDFQKLSTPLPDVPDEES